MREVQNEKNWPTASEATIAKTENPTAPIDQREAQEPEQLTLHGPQLWTLVAGLYLGLYLLALELTMLATVIPTLTSEFHTVADISWYEAAYVVTLCVFVPLVGRLYEQLRVKHVYLAFMLVFEAGLVICATATSSNMFIVGRAVNGLGSSGQFSGTMLMLGSACPEKIRPLVTAAAVSMISAGGGILLPMGGVIIVLLLLMRLPEPSNKPPVLQALKALPRRVDPLGFVQFAGAVTMLLLALTWGGSTLPWSSPTIIGLLCGGFGLLVVFGFWIRHENEAALITPSCLRQRSIYVGGLVVCLQGGASQAVPFYLPLWFQAIKGDEPSASAVHLLPSLVTMVVALISFGALVRKFQRVPPWAIAGSVISCVGAGLFTTLGPASSVGHWVGYQIITSPITCVQEFVPAAQSAMSMSVISLFMQLGIAVSVSASQTIFANQLPPLLRQYAPQVNGSMVQEAGAANARHLIPPSQFSGFLKAYNQAATDMFYFPMAACALAAVISFALEWKRIGVKDEEDDI
ncbi:Major facilitator superfamily domain, general substrate transporter [Akanthomyces lecanii RCEF 1005]|uniref:Major facilitator superfamily domain, general substrate transporter n=1 Tax=Akanthomyces lecanii RCEF 1005 TaxID=1081108 RepID=A0A168I748_CORDF|nr:Major facilitator superfamily domain, general substrate transporter [Akanthomyces lecanii RCEF 1005]